MPTPSRDNHPLSRIPRPKPKHLRSSHDPESSLPLSPSQNFSPVYPTPSCTNSADMRYPNPQEKPVAEPRVTPRQTPQEMHQGLERTQKRDMHQTCISKSRIPLAVKIPNEKLFQDIATNRSASPIMREVRSLGAMDRRTAAPERKMSPILEKVRRQRADKMRKALESFENDNEATLGSQNLAKTPSAGGKHVNVRPRIECANNEESGDFDPYQHRPEDSDSKESLITLETALLNLSPFRKISSTSDSDSRANRPFSQVDMIIPPLDLSKINTLKEASKSKETLDTVDEVAENKSQKSQVSEVCSGNESVESFRTARSDDFEHIQTPKSDTSRKKESKRRWGKLWRRSRD